MQTGRWKDFFWVHCYYTITIRIFFFLGSFKSESVHVRVNKEFASLIFAHVYADTFLISSNATEWSVPTMVYLFLPIFLSLMYEEHRWKYY